MKSLKAKLIEDKLIGHEGTPTQMEQFWRDVTIKQYQLSPDRVQSTIDTVRKKNSANADVMQNEYDRLRKL